MPTAELLAAIQAIRDLPETRKTVYGDGTIKVTGTVINGPFNELFETVVAGGDDPSLLLHNVRYTFPVDEILACRVSMSHWPDSGETYTNVSMLDRQPPAVRVGLDRAGKITEFNSVGDRTISTCLEEEQTVFEFGVGRFAIPKPAEMARRMGELKPAVTVSRRGTEISG